jgi:BMFP domain-containing protein YqiC
MLSEEQLREIEERVNKATPGPWRLGTYNVWADGERPPRLICDADTALAVRERFMMDQDDANSDFIAHARQDTPSLLATIRELQARLDDSEHGFKLALGDSGEYRRQVEELQARVLELELKLRQRDDPDDDCECVVRTELETRVEELEGQLEARIAELASIGDGE